MFDSSRSTSRPDNAVEIVRVRNGFVLRRAADYRTQGVTDNPYVFSALVEVYEFLVENDFEVTDE